MKKILSLILMLLLTETVLAKNIKTLALYYEEVEEGVGAQTMRYLINEEFIRIDNGDPKADFILFDVNKKTIFSVNHEDQTILKINNYPWKQPEFDFKTTVIEKPMLEAPKIFNKTVFNYQAKAEKAVCTQVFLIKDTYPEQMQTLYLYQQVLSGQQVTTLKSTPKELQTPCFLVDQVYHAGEYYLSGLPVQITYSRGYAKLLKDIKPLEVDTGLFKLPKDYSDYKLFSG